MASVISYAQVIADTETSHSCAVRRTHKSSLVGRVSLRGGLTLHETFLNSVKLNSGRRCLGYRPIDSLNNIPGQFLFRTYAEIYRSVKYMASGMVKESLLNPNSENLLTLGIFLKNAPAWIVAENAAYYLNGVVVPLYDTLGTDTLEFIVNQTELQTIVCSSKELKMLKHVASLCPKLKTVIVTDLSIPIAVCAEMMHPVGIRVISMHNLERIGAAYPSSPSPPIPSDIATICFTSGTTGMPKGAIISHQNMVSVMAAGLEGVILARPDDLYLSFLPLPHIFERIVVNSLLASGAGVGFYRGDITKVVEDLAALQPTVFCAVPRLYTRIHDKIVLKISEEKGISGKVLRLALSTKSKNFRENGEVKHGLWDRLVFQKIKVSLGLQNVRLIISGGAPLPATTMEFFRVLMGGGTTCHEGYGQTETTGATSITYPEDLSRGHVGGPFPNCEIRLEDVPDMGYLHSDRMHGDIPCEGRGEVWVRGPGVIRGYYKNDVETEAAGLKDKSGWLRSGDIGMWTLNGQLSLIDRKKNLFKLSQGEYIAVEKVEGILGQSPLISQIFVYGDSAEDKLVAMVVLDEDAVKSWRLEGSKGEAGDKDLLKAAVLTQMKDTGRGLGLKGFELVYSVTVEKIAWTPENGLLTPTMKLKREALKGLYQSQIKAMYLQLKKEGSPNSRL